MTFREMVIAIITMLIMLAANIVSNIIVKKETSIALSPRYKKKLAVIFSRMTAKLVFRLLLLIFVVWMLFRLVADPAPLTRGDVFLITFYMFISFDALNDFLKALVSWLYELIETGDKV